MSNIKLDLKQFKHVSSDEKSTTLKHKDGHSLTLAHKGLSKDNQAQLKALSEMSKSAVKSTDKGQAVQEQQAKDPGSEPQKYAFGAMVDKAVKSLDDFADKRYADQAKNDIITTDKKAPSPDPDKVKKYGIDKAFAEGGQVDPEIPEALQPNTPIDTAMSTLNNPPATMEGANPQLQYESRLKEMHDYGAAGSPGEIERRALDETLNDSNRVVQETKMRDVAAQQEQQVKATNQAEAAQAGIKLNNEPVVPNMPQASPQASIPSIMPEAAKATAGKGPADNLDDTEKMMRAGYAAKMGGIKAEADARGALGKAESDAINKNMTDQQEAMSSFKQHYNDLEKERQGHMADIRAGYINPDLYWTGDKNGNGSHSRIMTGIGMILAGFNPSDKPNAAIDFLKHQMDANIDAQKANLNSKQNLLAENLKQFGNLKDATAMTKVMQSDILSNQLMQAAATAKNPIAQAEAQKAAGQLQLESAPVMQQFAIRRAMLGLANSPANGNPSDTGAQEQMISYLRMTNPEMAKEMESRLLPGIGMAKIPLTPAVREQITSHQKLQDSAQDLMTYSKTHSNLIPGTAEYNFGVTKAMAFQQMVREGLLGTVFRESEKPLLEKFVSENPAGAFKSFTSQPQLRAIMESNLMGLNHIKQANGLPVKPMAAPANPNEGKVATNAQGQKIRMTNGKWIPAQ